MEEEHFQKVRRKLADVHRSVRELGDRLEVSLERVQVLEQKAAFLKGGFSAMIAFIIAAGTLVGQFVFKS